MSTVEFFGLTFGLLAAGSVLYGMGYLLAGVWDWRPRRRCARQRRCT